jgi:hypothetical protein
MGSGPGAVPPSLADAVFAALAHAPFTAYVTLLDLEAGRSAFPQFFATAEDTYATGLMFLPERFQMLLEERDERGIIVVDSRFREDDARLRRFFAALAEEGTPYVRLDRIIEGLFLGPSEHSIGLQCADLVVSCTASAERGVGQARGYLRTLLARFATHPATGEIEGVGLKRFPELVPRLRAGNGFSESRRLGELDEAAERVRDSHLRDRRAVHLEQPRARHEVGEAACARDRHVEPVA